jgi:predicted nucleic acid-binding protein
MIVLDTNVLSELMRAVPNANLLRWADACELSDIATTSVTQAEILYGISIMDDGRRKDSLIKAARGLFEEDFAGRILPFDAIAAAHFADIASMRRRIGRPISQADAQIAAIVRSHGARLATRNLVDFTDCGIELLNPF